MNNTYNVDEEVEKILEILDSKDDITFDPYFYSRLSTGLNKERNIARGNMEQLIAFSTLLLIIIGLNVVSIRSYFTTSSSASISRTEYLQEFAKDYSVFDNQESTYTFSKRQ